MKLIIRAFGSRSSKPAMHLAGMCHIHWQFWRNALHLAGSFGQKWAATPISAAVLRAKWGSKAQKAAHELADQNTRIMSC